MNDRGLAYFIMFIMVLYFVGLFLWLSLFSPNSNLKAGALILKEMAVGKKRTQVCPPQEGGPCCLTIFHFLLRLILSDIMYFVVLLSRRVSV